MKFLPSSFYFTSTNTTKTTTTSTPTINTFKIIIITILFLSQCRFIYNSKEFSDSLTQIELFQQIDEKDQWRIELSAQQLAYLIESEIGLTSCEMNQFKAINAIQTQKWYILGYFITQSDQQFQQNHTQMITDQNSCSFQIISSSQYARDVSLIYLEIKQHYQEIKIFFSLISKINPEDEKKKLFAHFERYKSRVLQLDDQSEINVCPNGFFRDQLDCCMECPFSCATCFSTLKCLSCKAGSTLPASLCLCDKEQHLFLTPITLQYECLDLNELLLSTKVLCPTNYGFLKMKDYGSFCFPCSSLSCRRCSFVQDLNKEYDPEYWQNYGIEQGVKYFFIEKCERCLLDNHQLSKDNEKVCINASENCLANYACTAGITFLGDQCINCDETFSFYNKSENNCVTLPQSLSYPTSSPKDIFEEVGLAWTNTLFQCPEKQTIAYDSKTFSYKCIPCAVINCLRCSSDQFCEICTDQTEFNSITGKCFDSQIKLCQGDTYWDSTTQSCISPICSQSYFFDWKNLECKECPKSCVQCKQDKVSKGIVCSECVDNYELVTMSLKITITLCKLPCQRQQFRDPSKFYECSQCQKSCKQCASLKKCIECDEVKGYYFISQIQKMEAGIRLQQYINYFQTHYKEGQEMDVCLWYCQKNSYLYSNALKRNLKYRNSDFEQEEEKEKEEAQQESNEEEEEEDKEEKIIQEIIEPIEPAVLPYQYPFNDDNLFVEVDLVEECRIIAFCELSDLTSNFCFQCDDGLYRNRDGNCSFLPECSQGSYFDLQTQKCLSCPPFCETCYLNLNLMKVLCKSCIKELSLNSESTLCQQNEPYQINSSDICSKKFSFKVKEECVECISEEYILIDGLCIHAPQTVCSDGSFFQYSQSLNRFNCFPCQDYCVSCNADYSSSSYSQYQIPQCLKCQDNFSLSKSLLLCLPQYSDQLKCNNSSESLQHPFYSDNTVFCYPCHQSCQSCYDFQSPFICKSCKEGYSLQQNSTCQRMCPEHYFFLNDKCVSCFIQNCERCSNSTQCEKCSEFYTLTEDSASCTFNSQNFPILSCPQNSILVKEVNSCYCLDSSYSFTWPTCTSQDTPPSLMCQNNYFYSQQEETCKKCPLSQDKYIASCEICQDSFSCLKCYQGFFLKNLTCFACQDHCLSCDSGANCFSCEPGFFLEMDSQTFASSCVKSCSSGYLPSLDSAFLLNRDELFPQTSYDEFISELYNQQSISNNRTTRPTAVFNSSKTIFFLPKGFSTIENIILAMYMQQKVFMTCVVCPENCIECPSNFIFDSNMKACISSYEKIPTLICSSCFQVEIQFDEKDLILKLTATKEIADIKWNLDFVEGLNSQVSEITQFEIMSGIANLISNSSQFKVPSIYLIKNTILHFSAAYKKENNYELQNIQIKVLHEISRSEYRDIEQIGISNPSFTFISQDINNYEVKLSHANYTALNFFLHTPFYFPNQFTLSLLISYSSSSSSLSIMLPLENSFAGQLSLNEVIPFTSSNDYINIIFELLHNESEIKYLKVFQLEFIHKSLDIENNLSSNLEIQSAQQAFLISLSLFRQMLHIEKSGEKAQINERIDYQNLELHREIMSTSFGIGEYLLLKESSEYEDDIEEMEKIAFKDTFSNYSSSKKLENCNQNKEIKFGYYCQVTYIQNEYLLSSLSQISGHLVTLSNSSSLSERDCIFILRSIRLISRMAQNNSSTLLNLQSALAILSQKGFSSSDYSCIIFLTEISISELIYRNSLYSSQSSSLQVLQEKFLSFTKFAECNYTSEIFSIFQTDLLNSSLNSTLLINSQLSIQFPPLASSTQFMLTSSSLSYSLSIFNSSNFSSYFTLVSPIISLKLSQEIQQIQLQFQISPNNSSTSSTYPYEYSCFDLSKNESFPNCSLKIENRIATCECNVKYPFLIAISEKQIEVVLPNELDKIFQLNQLLISLAIFALIYLLIPFTLYAKKLIFTSVVSQQIHQVNSPNKGQKNISEPTMILNELNLNNQKKSPSTKNSEKQSTMNQIKFFPQTPMTEPKIEIEGNIQANKIQIDEQMIQKYVMSQESERNKSLIEECKIFIESFNQIKEFESIQFQKPSPVVNNEIATVPSCKFTKIHLLFSSLIVSRVGYYFFTILLEQGIKRPFSSFFQQSVPKIFSMILISFLEILQIFVFAFYLSHVEIIGVLLIYHFFLTLILNVVLRNRFQYIFITLIVAGLLLPIGYFLQGLIKNELSFNELDQWSQKCLIWIISDFLGVQSLFAFISMTFFNKTTKFQWLYDYDACLSYFNYFHITLLHEKKDKKIDFENRLFAHLHKQLKKYKTSLIENAALKNKGNEENLNFKSDAIVNNQQKQSNNQQHTCQEGNTNNQNQQVNEKHIKAQQEENQDKQNVDEKQQEGQQNQENNKEAIDLLVKQQVFSNNFENEIENLENIINQEKMNMQQVKGQRINQINNQNRDTKIPQEVNIKSDRVQKIKNFGAITKFISNKQFE